MWVGLLIYSFRNRNTLCSLKRSCKIYLSAQTLKLETGKSTNISIFSHLSHVSVVENEACNNFLKVAMVTFKIFVYSPKIDTLKLSFHMKGKNFDFHVEIANLLRKPSAITKLLPTELC